MDERVHIVAVWVRFGGHPWSVSNCSVVLIVFIIYFCLTQSSGRVNEGDYLCCSCAEGLFFPEEELMASKMVSVRVCSMIYISISI